MNGTYFGTKINQDGVAIESMREIGNIEDVFQTVKDLESESINVVVPYYAYDLREKLYDELRTFEFDKYGNRLRMEEGEKCNVIIGNEIIRVRCVYDNAERGGCNYCAFHGKDMCHRISCEVKHFELI